MDELEKHKYVIRKEYENIIVALARMETEIAAERKLTSERFEARDEANTIAFSEANRRLNGMNEVREQLKEQAGTFISRDYFDSKLEAMDARLKKLETDQSRTGGRDSAIYAVVVAGAALAGVIIDLVLRATGN